MSIIKKILLAIILLANFSCHEPEIKNTKYLKNTGQEEQNSNSKKKILFHHYRLEAGGIGKSVFTLLKNLDYSKYEVDLLLMTKFGMPISEFNQIPKEVNIISLYDPFFKSSKPSKNSFIETLKKGEMFLFENLMKFYKKSNWLTYNRKLGNKTYDLEIALFSHGLEFLINSPLSSKKIAWIHMDLKDEKKISPSKEINYTIKNLTKVDTIITVSHQNKESLASIIPEIENKIEVIYNPISVEKTRSKSQEAILEKKYEPLQLISIGRLHPQKGFDRLINVCQKLKNEDQLDFHLWIIGEGPERTKLENQIRKFGLENTVKIIGFKENPYPYLRAADLFVLSSRHEAMPYVLLEATILNKAIMSTHVSGSEEILKATLAQEQLTNKGEYGLLSQNSEEGIYQGLKEMIRDKSLRDSFINKEKDFSAFEPPYIIKQVERLFDELMEN